MLKSFKLQKNLDGYLVKLKKNPKLAVAISREHANNIKSNDKLAFYCFGKSEYIHEYAIKFLVRKDFCYLNELNRFIAMASAGGLIDKFRKDIIQLNNTYTPKPKFNQITFGHLVGAFFIWIILIILICCFFLIEKITFYEVKKRNPSQFWLIFQMIIDSDRHFLRQNKWK